jgi:hypothetical protein
VAAYSERRLSKPRPKQNTIAAALPKVVVVVLAGGLM